MLQGHEGHAERNADGDRPGAQTGGSGREIGKVAVPMRLREDDDRDAGQSGTGQYPILRMPEETERGDDGKGQMGEEEDRWPRHWS